MSAIDVQVLGAMTAHGATFSQRLLAWFDRYGRKHLPWQQNPTPYRVWVSEIMLQQTQVTTVIPYYESFIARFPNVAALAAAPLDEVLHLWTGLGYYARARNLHKAATVIVQEHAGVFPRTLEAVQALPGIGRTTAGAVLALGLQQRHAILDGNVKRVLARYFGVHGFPGDAKVERELWLHAEACTPLGRVAEYTQAIMDLGATVCVRSQPKCLACPQQANCVARLQGLQQVLPTPRPKKIRPTRVAYVVLACNAQGAVLLERRPPSGLWGGLWTFPQFDSHEEAVTWLQQRFAVESPVVQRFGAYAHAFTHFDLMLYPLRVEIDKAAAHVADHDRYAWYDSRAPLRIGLAKPAVDLLQRLHVP